MSMLFGSPEELLQWFVKVRDWIQVAKPWIEFGLGLLGIGTTVLIGVLTWVLRKLRSDIEVQQKAAEGLQETTRVSIELRDVAEARARASDHRAQLALEELRTVRGPADEALNRAHAEVAFLTTKLQRVRSSVTESAEFWSRAVGRRLDGFDRLLRDSIPILLFANQKGGVGKTTLSANLAACFARRGEKVLVVDLDYQGSLTSLMLAEQGLRPDVFPSMADILHADALSELWPRAAINTAAERLDYISCWYPFETVERRLEYLWVLGDTDDDVRYRLARALLSPSVQGTYDRVIIDAPPRMTAGFLNGFCVSTHLFVPTVVDRVSAIAVGTFARQFRELSTVANQSIRFAGIIGTMSAFSSRGAAKISNDALPSADAAERAVRNHLGTNDEYFIRSATMGRTPRISYSTEEGIAYLRDPQVRPMFESLADEVSARAPRRATHGREGI